MIAALLVVTLGASCGTDAPRAVGGPERVERLSATVVATHPHSPSAFTQGLLFVGRDRLMESAGGYGKSELRELDAESGELVASRPLDPDVFAEGLGSTGDHLVQLTWREGRAIVWDSRSLERIGEHSYAGEGWGLDFDETARRWVQSDGSDRLTFRDPTSFVEVGGITVRRGGRPVSELNELEVVGGDVWANVWLSDELVRIDLATGEVTAVVDLAELGPDNPASSDDVLNGIAHRPDDPPNRLWVTGKRWPLLYEIELS